MTITTITLYLKNKPLPAYQNKCITGLNISTQLIKIALVLDSDFAFIH